MKKNIIKDSSLKSSPGSLNYVGRVVEHSTKIKMIEYNSDEFKEESIELDFSKIRINNNDNFRTWLNIDGIHQPEVVQEIGKVYNLHPLLMEDILNTQQKPKFENYGDDLIYITMKALIYNQYTKEIESEHISLVLGHDFLLTFQEERTSNIFEEIEVRLKSSVGKSRKNSVDYLLFSIIDLLIDNYLEVIQQIEEDLALLEDNIIHQPKERNQNLLYDFKREISKMRKFAFPVREILNSVLLFEESTLINKNTKLYFRDAYDHAIQVVELLDFNREMVASLMELYLSQVSNKMNSVMKVLTVISVIFMPLTFIVGVYGMNFDNMPELHWHNGYFMVWGVVVLLSISMLMFFRKKQWI